MTPFLERFVEIEREIARERSDFVLFALMLREEMAAVVSTSDPGISQRWDLIASAPWLPSTMNRQETDYFLKKIRQHFGSTGDVPLGRIVFLSPNDQLVQRVNTNLQIEHKLVPYHDHALFGANILSVYVITSKPLAVPTAQSS